jgi:hypothetical protein
MRKIAFIKFILFSLVFQFQIYSQEVNKISFDLTTSLGNSILTKMLTGTDQQASLFAQTNFYINIPIRQSILLSTGIGYENNRILVDGYFSESSGQYSYQVVPVNYTQNEILLDYFNIPILFRKEFEKREFLQISVGFGSILGYLVDAKQKAKINGNKVTSDAPIENKFRYGINLDCEFKRKSNKNNLNGIFAIGLYYQISKYIEQNKSFVPFTAYIRFGTGI